MTRRKLVAGNWKMNGTASQARELASAIVAARGAEGRVDLLVAPPFTALSLVAGLLEGSRIGLAAQNMHGKTSGAFTGEISAPMLREAGCGSVLLGHSERRHVFGETDEQIREKLRAALAAALGPVLCVGETLAERDGGQAAVVVARQLDLALAGLAPEEMGRVTIAYEPVWAIGTGRTATPDQALEMHRTVRSHVSRLGADAATVRILYGGSVTPDNALELMRGDDIDGVLVGGASLKADSFVKIVDAAVAASEASQ
jgi:triosephosphate isomerase